ncbi:MAG: lysylphosphatidylglycerol synthase domain-containing protein [Limnospira sp.]
MLGLAIAAIVRELQGQDYRKIWINLRQVDPRRLLGAIGFTVMSYGAIACYDILAFAYIKQPLSRAKIAFASLIAYAVSPSIGFAAFSGGAIRYRFYSSWGISPLKIAQAIVFSNLSLWVGIFAIGGLVFLIEPLILPSQLDLPFDSLKSGGIAFLLLTGIYLFICWLHPSPLQVRSLSFRFPSLKLALSQIVVFGFDWGLAAAALYLLLPLQDNLSYPQFFGIYMLAMVAGLLSTVPGGLGVFETVFLVSLTPMVKTTMLLSLLLVFRGIYYFLPLLIAVVLMGVYEWKKSRADLH